MNSGQLINAVNDIQVNAQASLPVLPNNGNPQGANNMPAVSTAVPAAPIFMRPEDHYPWLRPSPAMDSVRQMLGARTPQQPVATQDMPAQAGPILPAQRMF